MLTFVKGFAYKFCFCLGLGTATYYSYGQVQKWVKTDQVKVIENVVEKHVTRENTVYDASNTPQEFNYEQPVMVAPPLAAADEASVVAPPAAPTEEKKDEEKKEEVAENKAENSEEVAGGVLPQQYPMAYPPQAGPVPASSTSNNEEAQAPVVPFLPNALQPSSPSNSSPTYSYGGSNPAYFIPTSGLDSNDIAALISPLKASFDDKMNSANGQLCEINGRHECKHRNNIKIHSLRWGMSEGLKKDVKFAIRSLGNASLELDFDFKVQNLALSEETVSVTARPTDILVNNEVRDAKNYRVIELRFADLNVHGEVLKQMQVTMVYEVTNGGLVLSNTSDLSFSRSQVEVLTTKWNPLAGEPTAPAVPVEQALSRHRRLPADLGSSVYLIADELTFSMSVEKSQ